jgi:outer membrane receptor protein involved in Fe transport
VSGGTEDTRYFLSGTWKRDEGLADNTGFSRQGVRINVDQQLGEQVDVSVSTSFNRSLAQRGFTNNGNNGGTAGYALAYQPNFQSLLPNEDGVFTTPALTTQGPGANPVQTHRLSRNDAETNRFTGGATVNFTPLESASSSLRFTAGAGVDIFNQADEIFTPPELFFEQVQTLPGTALEQSAVSRLTNWNANVVHTLYPGSGGIGFTTSAGIQFEDQQIHRTRITNTNLVPGQSHVDQGTNPNVDEQFTKERTFALYAQEAVTLLDNRLLLVGGVRAERSSANGDVNKYYVFPKASASYRFTDIGLLGNGGEFKLRAAYGETGNQPLFGQKFTTLNTPQFGQQTGFTVAGAAGAPNVSPERLKEVELGFDATMFDDRAQLEFTVYRRNTTNLLLQRVPAPSTGFTSEVFNGGNVRNQGIEAGLGITPVRTRDVSIISRATFTLNRNKVIELPVAPFRPPLSGFGGLGVTFIEEGQPMTQIVGFEFDGDERAAEQTQIGDAAPDFRVGFTNSVRVKATRFSMVWDWQQGGDIINLTQYLYDDADNAADFGTPEHARRVLAQAEGVNAPYIEDATFLKLREVSFGVELPQSLVGFLYPALDRIDLSVTGRNLLMFTRYSGLDPEVANFGATAVRNNLDITPFPPSRSVFVNLQFYF